MSDCNAIAETNLSATRCIFALATTKQPVKRILLILLNLTFTSTTFADHIAGGEVFYKYLGPGSAAGTSRYQVSLRLFKDCDLVCGPNTRYACLPRVGEVVIWPVSGPYLYYRFKLPLTDSTTISLTTYPDCIANKPKVCYEVKTYSDSIELPITNDGYIIVYQNCCRAASVNQSGIEFTLSGSPGATYTAIIPGKNALSGEENNEAVFKLKDTALVCAGGKFAIDFSADDPDGDSITYSFAPAYNGGVYFADGCTATPTDGISCGDEVLRRRPPYNYINYNSTLGYSGTQPLGSGVTLGAHTGLISGIAPAKEGHYIVNVVATEWRHGKIISVHQKDLIIHVEECNLPVARLDSVYISCDGLGLSFQNLSNSPLIKTYNWDFGDTKTLADISTLATPSYTYPDSGTYVVTLITNKGQECSDTATALAKLYPGFVPDFSAKGGCIVNPYQFTDQTSSQYGFVNSWRWDFGDKPLADTSTLQNPKYLYSGIQLAQVRLIVGDSKGCTDTIKKIIEVYDQVPLQLSFRDTLICKEDSLLLHLVNPIAASVTYTWTPVVNISDAHVADPLVFPQSSTTYHVEVTDSSGCNNSDSVSVRVIPFVTVDAGNDTTICLMDSLHLAPVSNAEKFSWSPTTDVSDVNVKAPFVRPLISTVYKVLATVGHCNASDSIKINPVAYPSLTLGEDTTICYGSTVILAATTTAPLFSWSPVNSLSQSNTLTPVAAPQTTTSYIITVTDVLGCPKPVSDTMVVTVVTVQAFAGNDTVIVANQPLQLNATGGVIYSWSPSVGLSNPLVANPVAILDTRFDSVTYHVKVATANGCSADADVKVLVMKTPPEIFVPSAFTPNHDGLNDVIRPKLAGIKQLKYFRIFNRWGNLVFATSTINNGWDGRFSGVLQPTATYVYVAEAIDYTGKTLFRKGIITLIR